MVPLGRALVGVVLGGVGARALGLLARLHVGPGSMARKATRRTFVRNAALGSSAVVLAEITAGAVWLMWPNKTGEFGGEIPLSAETIPEVNAEPYLNVPGKFYLVHNQDGLLALYTKCPHLGCTVPWEGPPESDQAFQCPCHGSMYDYNGNRTGGPAPRPMDYMAISVNDDGSISVDTGDIRTRSGYDPSQAAPYPA
jgi:cytochrome b6-f complex iron-sulfur subunit